MAHRLMASTRLRLGISPAGCAARPSHSRKTLLKWVAKQVLRLEHRTDRSRSSRRLTATLPRSRRLPPSTPIQQSPRNRLAEPPVETAADAARTDPVADGAYDDAKEPPADPAAVPADPAAEPAPVGEPMKGDPASAAANTATLEPTVETTATATPVPVASETPKDTAAAADARCEPDAGARTRGTGKCDGRCVDPHRTWSQFRSHLHGADGQHRPTDR